MALFNKLNSCHNNLLFWKIIESEEELRYNLNLSEPLNSKLDKLKSISQRKQFLSIQNLLKLLDIKNDDLYYDANGKPKLSSGKFISISHSFDYCGVIICKSKVGIDIEKFRPKILNISKKFVSSSELKLIKENSIQNITKIWTIKEAVYKAFGQPGIDFKKNIIIETLDREFNKASVKVFKNKIIEYYSIEIINFPKYICSVAKLIK